LRLWVLDQAQDVIDEGIDDDIGNSIDKHSRLINKPSAEGLLSAVNTSANDPI